MEEISLGDYVLSGGEPAALVLLDAVIRLLPGVMGAADSATDESFSRRTVGIPALHAARRVARPPRAGRLAFRSSRRRRRVAPRKNPNASPRNAVPICGRLHLRAARPVRSKGSPP